MEQLDSPKDWGEDTNIEDLKKVLELMWANKSLQELLSVDNPLGK